MMTRIVIRKGLALACLLTVGHGRASAQATTSFETVPSGVYTNGSVVDGWTVSSNEVSVVADPKGAYSGANYLALANGHISKTFATQPGARYQLLFHGKGFGLTHWWPGDNDAKDIIGTNNGTLKNMAFSTGKVSQAFSFNGNNSEVDFGSDVGNFGANDFAVDFWIRLPPSATGELACMEKRVECQAAINFWEIQFGGGDIVWTNAPAGHMKSYIPGDHDSFTGEIVSSKAMNDGVFHHAALVRNGMVYSYYIDGILDSSTTPIHPGIANIDNPAPFRLGQSRCTFPGVNGGDRTMPFVGDLDELDLFNRALSPAEVYAIYTAGSDGKYGPVSTLMPNLQLTIDGVMTDTIILDEAAGPWQLFTNNFTAKKSRVTIGLEGNALGVLVDDIQLIPQPAP